MRDHEARLKQLLIAILITLAPAESARAGWWQSFCERHLIADDPYQFETVASDWLDREIGRLEIRAAWNKITERDARMLEILRAERMRRF
jgi:hypothetical protein